MSEKQETIADIVAELRQDYKGRPPMDRAETTWCRRRIANRIEVAYRVETLKWVEANAGLAKLVDPEKMLTGNGVKMREALEATNKFLEVAIVNGKVTSQDISRLRNIVSTALTESPRNCDRFDDLNSAQRYYIEHGCPKGLGKIVDGEIRKTPWKSQFEKWLFSKEKGENDAIK